MLWAALHLPLLPLDALRRGDPDDAPLAIAHGEMRPIIMALNAGARRAGLHPGMSLSAALAVAPQVRVLARDGTLEKQALAEIAQWVLQFSPSISIESPDSVLLEIGAGLKLHGGAPALVDTMGAGLAALGFNACIAAAPTPTAALMLAQARQARIVHAPAEFAARLARLPVAALRCAADIRGTLADLGIDTVGALLRLPRDGLVRRFGPALIETIDRALGRLPDPRPPYIAPDHFSARLELPAPAWEAEALLFGVQRLVTGLIGWLLGRGLGIMRLRLELDHEDHAATVITLDLSAPSRDAAHLGLLLRERLHRTRLPDRVEAITLADVEHANLAARDRALFPGIEAADDVELIERLCARLGDAAVCALAPHADYRPEHAWRRASAARDTALAWAPRPLWLLPHPQPLARFLPAARAPIVLMDGPERIESGWWEEQDVRRDYFVARAADGQWLWIFKPLDDGADWYVHGVFA